MKENIQSKKTKVFLKYMHFSGITFILYNCFHICIFVTLFSHDQSFRLNFVCIFSYFHILLICFICGQIRDCSHKNFSALYNLRNRNSSSVTLNVKFCCCFFVKYLKLSFDITIKYINFQILISTNFSEPVPQECLQCLK